MIEIKNKVDCCGCNACGDACAQGAITFKTDIEGFWYPEVDKVKCVDCGLCEKVCPIINVDKLKHNDFDKPKCYAAVHKNLEVRFDSTSGGLFSAFAELILKEGGLVGGAQYTDDLYVEQILISDKKELHKLRGSKYLQSDCNGFYKAIKKALNDGKKVLICGSPCQMAAVRSYLGKKYENLYILDYICRGIPSGMIFHKYINYWERKVGGKAIYFKFKIKELGWRKRTMKIGFDNGIYIYDDCNNSLYDLGYHKTHAFCRPSCYDCKFNGTPLISDISLGDFWGIEKLHMADEFDRDMGTSVVLCNNNKGQDLLSKVSSKLYVSEVTFNSVLKGNPAIVSSHPLPIVDRNEFYSRIYNEPFENVITELVQSVKINNVHKPSQKDILRPIYKILKKHFQILKLGFGVYIKLYKNNKFGSLFRLDSGLIVQQKNVVFNISKKSDFTVTKGILNIGHKRIKGSKIESRILVEKGAKLSCEGNFLMFYGADVEVFKGGHLRLKGNSGFNINCTIICSNSIIIGEYVAIGRNVTIRDNNGGHYISRQGYKDSRPVIIEDHAWLCEGCTIMPGVRIGTGAIVGAGSIVYTNVPPFTMVSGNPAKIVDKDIYWKA